MLLLGIGFAKKSWNFITNQLQKKLSHQLNIDLFEYPSLDSTKAMDIKEIKSKPNLEDTDLSDLDDLEI